MSTRIKTIAIVVLSVLLCSFYSLNTSAFDTAQLVVYKSSDTKPYFNIQFSDNTSSGWTNASWTNPNNYIRNIKSYQIRSSSNGKPSELQQGRFVTAIIRIGFPGTNNQWNTTGAWSFNADTGNTCQILDVSEAESQMHQVNNETWQWANLIVTCKMVSDTNYIPIGLTVRTSNFGQTWQTQALGYTIWSPANPATSSDVEAVTSAVNSMKNAINSKLDTTNNKLDTLDISINDLKQAQEDYNQQQQQQYEDEKQEESDREDNISGSSEDAQGMFNFNVLNPFSGLFGLFSSSCSVNIPILSSWIHSPTSSYPSWWCQNSTMSNIKDTLTPVFGMASMMLLFGFVVRWLSNNSGDIYGARNFKKGLE